MALVPTLPFCRSLSTAFVINSFKIGGMSENLTGNVQAVTDEYQEPWNTVPKGRRGGRQQRQHEQNQYTDKWSGSPLPIEYIPPESTNEPLQPFMILLAGLPGSGKSTFSRSLVDAMPYKVRKSALTVFFKCRR